MTGGQQDNSIRAFRGQVRSALATNGGQLDVLRLHGLAFDIATYLINKIELSPECTEHLLLRLPARQSPQAQAVQHRQQPRPSDRGF